MPFRMHQFIDMDQWGGDVHMYNAKNLKRKAGVVVMHVYLGREDVDFFSHRDVMISIHRKYIRRNT